MSFHHRTTFGNKRKSHKINGKSKSSSSSISKSFGRINEDKEKSKTFRHCNQYRDIGKAQRKAISKEKRKIHREKLIKNKLKYYGGKQIGGIPKIIVIIGLSPYSNTNKVKKHLLNYCDNDGNNDNDNILNECQANRNGKKQNFIFYECFNRNDIYSILDICKIADIILLISSPKPKNINILNNKWNECILGLDEKSNLFCSLIRNVCGGTTIYGLYQPKHYKEINNLKKNNKYQQCKLDPLIKNTYLNYLNHQFTTNSKNNSKNIRIFHCYDMEQIFRFMFLNKNYNDLKSINCEWKQKRPHLLIQNIYNYNKENNILSIDGYLRGSTKLNINRPIHITGFDGHYLIKQIDGLLDNDNNDNNQNDDILMDFINNDNDDIKQQETITIIHADNNKQDTLQSLENLNALSSQFDQTIITENELKELEPQDFIDDDDDIDDIDMNIDDDDDDDDIDININEFEFEDEVETPINIRAKDRFAQYRGMKQFYKTKWDKFELLPVEYSQISNMKDWKKAIKETKLENIVKQEIENKNENEDNQFVECGKKVRIYIAGISFEIYQKLLSHFNLNKPLIIWSLLKYENKISVCHYLIKGNNDNDNININNDNTFIFDVGFRRFKCKPIFSENSMGNKHLIKKGINNEFMIASIYGYITFPPIGVIIFNNNDKNEMIGNGSLHSINTHRILIKRKILTGSAIRVQRRRAIIKYMFNNSDDVNYFKPIDLWTKHGLKGKIEQPIGDKGFMKCFFNGNIKQNDTICLSLYKRIFPYKDDKLFAS